MQESRAKDGQEDAKGQGSPVRKPFAAGVSRRARTRKRADRSRRGVPMTSAGQTGLAAMEKDADPKAQAAQGRDARHQGRHRQASGQTKRRGALHRPPVQGCTAPGRCCHRQAGVPCLLPVGVLTALPGLRSPPVWPGARSDARSGHPHASAQPQPDRPASGNRIDFSSTLCRDDLWHPCCHAADLRHLGPPVRRQRLGHFRGTKRFLAPAPQRQVEDGCAHRLAHSRSAPSCRSRAAFVSTPPGAEKPPNQAVPVTRWQGMRIGNGFAPQACPTACAGAPTALAIWP